MSIRVIPAILSGGAGTRLWPLSTPRRPKQFHTLGHGQTLFEATLARSRGAFSGLEFTRPLIMCGKAHVPLAREALGAGAATFVIEPTPRNTAAIAAAAAAVAAEIDPEALVLLQPADHLVGDNESFNAALLRGASFARESIVTFGITPTRPATTYGYIKRRQANDVVSEIEAFKEKPDKATAKAYLDSGDYLWNAGIFLFHPRTLLREFEPNADIRNAALSAFALSRRDGDEIWLDKNAFSAARSAPLDIAVMEKTRRGVVVACEMGWADVGTWDEVWRHAPRDDEGFAILGAVAAADLTKIEASGVKALAIEGEDLVAMAAPRGVIILPRAQARNRETLRMLAAKL
jgi:mannose-1-phosphate guanylyltransferase/mannose-6-phosphate isomerase